MVTVYVLINPLNNQPFYVGSTVNVKSRLSQHNACKEGTPEKRQLVQYIRNNNENIKLLPLIVCSERAASKCEIHVYKLLVANGYTLYNDKWRVDSRQNYSSPDHWLNKYPAFVSVTDR